MLIVAGYDETSGGHNKIKIGGIKNMSVVSMKQLLEAGVHFGHHTRRWNPKMKEYIYGERNGVYIIDLQKTMEKIEESYAALRDIVRNNNKVLFVGTRKQIQEIIREEALRCEQFFVDKRWLGGTMTNFKTVRRSIAKLHRIEQMAEDGTFDVLPKKEVIELKKELAKLETFLGGIKDMQNLPGALFVVDPKTERNAVLEARKLGIPVFAIVDTNCDPDEVDYVIPANDDGVRAVRLIVGIMANAVIEGNGGAVEPYVLAEEPREERQEAPRRERRQPARRRPQTEEVVEEAEATEKPKRRTKKAEDVEVTEAVEETVEATEEKKTNKRTRKTAKKETEADAPVEEKTVEETKAEVEEQTDAKAE